MMGLGTLAGCGLVDIFFFNSISCHEVMRNRQNQGKRGFDGTGLARGTFLHRGSLWRFFVSNSPFLLSSHTDN